VVLALALLARTRRSPTPRRARWRSCSPVTSARPGSRRCSCSRRSTAGSRHARGARDALDGGLVPGGAQRVALRGLLFQSAARSADNGSFGLVNDYLRLARHFGIGLEPIALVMLIVAVLPVPLAILLEYARGRRA
jgi:hypothetical protein